LDVDAYPAPAPERRRQARKLLGVPDGATVLLHFGRNWELKGGDLFLETLKRLRDHGHDRIVGVTSRGSEPARELAAELGISDIVFTPEYVAEVHDLFAAADLFMATSRAEGMPLSVLEALASGVPVVATDIPGHALPGGPAGLLLSVPLDVEQLARGADEQLERDSDLRREDAELARDWIRERMGVLDWAARLIDLYEHTAPEAR
jgi:glycosyltransferase involved in cell wall biosynthesis